MFSDQKHPISFIIPAYNCQQTLAETVNSICDGNFMEGDEVIIVNDASSDNTLEIAKELQSKFPAIKILKHKINKGTAAAARNTGIENAQNDLIFCLDSDNVLVSGSINLLKQYMLSTNADAAAFGEIHFFTTVSEQIKEIVYKTVFKSGEFTLADALSTYYSIGHSGNYLFTKKSWLKAGRYFEPFLINQTLDSWTFTIYQLGTGTKLVKLKETYYLHRRVANSHWEREIKKGNVSIAGLYAIIPFLDLIEDDDVEYILSKEGRYHWVDELQKRPIRLKSGMKGTPSVEFIQIKKKANKKSLKGLIKRLLQRFTL
ncbi:glycosyltransferase family 2 protein [Rhodocytophaga aerolata]|uniref:Glycosyltransferase family 2 protein n=1 Tax=Rhodocytophaga aerolata TaxID=455078 RepID=A0ABT8RFY3_9BACT|nr:glycosyltransferase family 2 protein [Rhodocytophaga aerolata]MDO1451021.1 glycosyltransferase family 2 protein [Rhodocytophaga aerolata]